MKENRRERASRYSLGETLMRDGLTYKRVDSCSLDMMIFGARGVSVLPMFEDNGINYTYLLADDITFLSVLYYDIDHIYYAFYKRPDNPFARAKRNGEGMLQVMGKTGYGIIPDESR